MPFFIRLYAFVSLSAGANHRIYGQVFWLPDLPTGRAFPSFRQWQIAAFVPGYSGGTATDSHRLPLQPPSRGHPCVWV